jgi:hypothetical protein
MSDRRDMRAKGLLLARSRHFHCGSKQTPDFDDALKAFVGSVGMGVALEVLIHCRR